MVDIKCKKCRLSLFPHGCSVLNVHHEEVDPMKRNPEGSCSFVKDALYFDETRLTTWMTDLVNQGDWLRGKVICPGCSGRLGSFDFVTAQRCRCGISVVPPVHIVSSKVDLRISACQNGELDSQTSLPLADVNNT